MIIRKLKKQISFWLETIFISLTLCCISTSFDFVLLWNMANISWKQEKAGNEKQKKYDSNKLETFFTFLSLCYISTSFDWAFIMGNGKYFMEIGKGKLNIIYGQ